MKYYINLIKNKNYKAIIFSIFFFLLGCFCLYANLRSIVENGMQNNLDNNVWTGISIIDIISRSNWGMVIIGIINIYTGLMFAPRNYKGSQNDEDYVIKSSGDYIEIKYKDKEFTVKKETFQPTNLFFKDKNGKFVSMTTGYQIYNYVMYNHKEKTEKETTDGNIIGIEDVITKFSNVRLMNDDEKKWYIEYKKLKYRRKRISLILSILFYIIAAFYCFGSIIAIRNNLGAGVLGIIFLIIAVLFNRFSKRQIILIDKIMKGNTYIADCYSYDKKINEYDGGTDYLIKVRDNKGYYLNKWFAIPCNVYKNNEVVSAKLVIIGEDTKQIEIIAN